MLAAISQLRIRKLLRTKNASRVARFEGPEKGVFRPDVGKAWANALFGALRAASSPGLRPRSVRRRWDFKSIYPVPLEGLGPPTVSIGRNWIASIESELLVCMPCCSKRADRARTDSGDKRNG